MAFAGHCLHRIIKMCLKFDWNPELVVVKNGIDHYKITFCKACAIDLKWIQYIRFKM